MPTATIEKINLSDDERSRIRWSSTKRGFVVVTDFHRGPRGGRFRSVRQQATVVLDGAIELAGRERGRYRQSVRAVTIYEVDALGNVNDILDA